MRCKRIRLPRRVDGSPLPPVEIVDLKAAAGAVHPRTHEALVDARKAIVLLNRRGWSNFLTCRSCGRVWECPDCDVALILHRDQGAVACHHCGHRERIPSTLPGLRLGVDRPPRHGHRAPGARPRLAGQARPAARRRHPRRRRGAERLRARRARDPRRHAGRRQGPRLPRRRPRRRARRRLRPCGSRTSAPRSGPSRSSPSSRAARAAAATAA